MLTLSIIPTLLAIVRLEPSSAIPLWGIQGKDFFSITRTRDELSVVCAEDLVSQSALEDARIERGWRVLKVEGPLDFGLTGVLASLAQPLADAGISIFAISTFDTDYLMVKQEKFQKAVAVLGTFCKIQS